METRRPWKRSSRIIWLLEVGTVSVAALRNVTTGRDCSLNCSVAAAAVVCTHWTVCSFSCCCRGSGAVRDVFKLLFGRRLWTCNVMPLMRDALFCWTHLCNRVYNETDARLFDNLCRMTCLVDSDVSLSPLGLI